MRQEVISGIRPSFPGLSQSQGQVTHVLLTRSPLIHPASWASSFDLHVLSTPPAFILSQDQTLRKKLQNDTPTAGNNHQDIHSITWRTRCTTHGGAGTLVNQCVKTIGIKKLGTLLSSQTTDASGFRTAHSRRFAPEQLLHPRPSDSDCQPRHRDRSRTVIRHRKASQPYHVHDPCQLRFRSRHQLFTSGGHLSLPHDPSQSTRSSLQEYRSHPKGRNRMPW